MSNSPEASVRRYLAWVEDPSSAIDHDAVAEAEAAFAAATDPIERLHAAAARERAQAADASGLEAEFVAHAKAYADAEGIPAAAFVALGVSTDTLAQAGFAVTSTRGRRGPSARPDSRPAGAPRAPQVPVSQIKTAALQMPKRFTLAQVADRAGGGSPATVRKAVEELIAEGRVVSTGPDANHTGPGRAPTLYELV